MDQGCRRCIEPRHMERRGPQGETADRMHALEGRSPGGATASGQDTTGGSDQGMASPGEPGNVGEPRGALASTRWRRADQCGKDSRRWEEALASQASLASARDTKQDERYKVLGEAREHRTPPRWARGSLRGPESRGPGARGAWAGRRA